MIDKTQQEISILIVDDDTATRFMINQTLSKSSYVLYEAESGSEAIELLKDKMPDLILMDVEMTDDNGINVCREIRDMGHDVPIIMMTSRNDSNTIDAAFEAGATDFLTKPINWSLLVQRIRYAIRNEILKKDVTRNQL